eukprot:TRINITY_DN10336_c0_g1_i1.p1 TRINITY_DN10336_c0_g1~~TRINITY_DN10336_c0_g1_i1.p1  ORF type:complete len:802 (+),score=119.27 TRINITY_DN10336_c0_g1_i1:93-2498(+)
MAWVADALCQDAFKVAKPAGVPQFRGWDGQPLRVPESEYQTRLQGLGKAMEAEAIDVLIVVQPEDIYYITGSFTIGDSSPQALILHKKGASPGDVLAFMVARLIEVDQVKIFSWIPEVWTCPDVADIHDTVFCPAVQKVLPDKGVVGVQLSAISAAHYKRYCHFFDRHKGMAMQDASKVVEALRLQKSEYEQGCIRKASAASEMGIKAGMSRLKAGALLSELHTACYTALIESGSEVPGYLPIIRSTEPSGHGSWRPGECVASGNLVFLEAAACVHGHHAPLMRTAYVLGPEETKPPEWLEQAEKLIEKVFDTCLPMMVPGAIPSEIDAAGRSIMLSNSFGFKMAARLAYSTGSTSTQPTGHAGWGDADFSLVGHNKQPLKEGMVFHFIPWFQKYDQPSGPIGLSDTVIVTKSGGRRFGSMPLKTMVVRGDGSEWDRPITAELRSDTMTLPTIEMKAAMIAAKLGDDVFSEDPTVNKLELEAAELFGKEAALFVPTGTMGNLASLMVHCDRRGSEIILGSLSHVHIWEQGGISTLASIHARAIPQKPDGTMDLVEVEAAVRTVNDHFPTTRVLVLEQTHNMCGGRVLPMEYIDRAAELCRRHDLKLHVDGARIFSACAALDVTPKRMLRDVDSASVCLSKGLASPLGSLIVGTADFIRNARRARKALGGGMRQAGVVAACGLVALEHMSQPQRLKEDHRRAKELACALAKLPGLDVQVNEVESNIVMIDTKGFAAQDLVDKLKKLGTLVLAPGKHRIRVVTHYQVGDDHVRKTICDFETALSEIAPTGCSSEGPSKRAKHV